MHCTVHRCVAASSGIGSFVGIFAGSTAMGLVAGALASLVLQTRFWGEEAPTLEAGVALLFAYGSYLLAGVLDMSGIVAIVFCGMVRAAL